MAKKSLIAGEYIIEIADNGHVDVLRVFRNAKVTMEEIAKSKNFPVDEKWNTQDLGRHLVKEFGDGKTALFNDITINRFADGKIEIYQECKNVKEVLRTIGNQLGFHYEDTWNTQQFGSKLSDYLIEHKEEADKILQTKNARRKKENTEEALNISPAFGISETIIPINSNNMAKFNLTGSKTVAELKKEFNEAFGSRLKVYNGGSVADDNETLGNLGLKEDTAFECRSSRTAASFIESFKELGLKVTVWTRDYNVKVLDGLTLKSTGEIKNMATKKDMEDKIAYQREEKEDSAEDEEEHTYHVFVSGRVVRMNTLQMENAEDDDIENGFADGETWTETVKDTLNLYNQKEDLIENPDSFDEGEKLTEMFGDGDVDSGSCMIDATSDFSITVKDDDGNEICHIGAEDVVQISFEQGYETNIDDLDEEDEEDMDKKALIEENPRFGNADILNLCMNPDAWYWINVQEADTDEPIEFVINTKGKFDKDKMRFVRVLAEEWSHGLKSIEGIVALVYGQEETDMYDNGTVNDEATNLFVKTDEDDELHTVRVFDFTNWEED